MLSCLFEVQAQNAPAAQTSPAVQDETAILLDAPVADAAGPAQAASSVSSIWVLLRIVLVLAIVCAGIYGVVYLLKKTTKINAGNDPYIKNVASLAFSPNKSVRVVTVGSQAFVLGVTDQSISLISEITDRELIDAMNLESDRNSTVPAGNFTSVLKAFLPDRPVSPDRPASMDSAGEKPAERTSPSADSVSALATTDFLKKQRERLKNGSPE